MSNRRVAIVTGSTSGIGFGIARVLAAAGQRIVIEAFPGLTQHHL
jgi:NAD(P)-dependent dehydrogenase (short-subunit alcohol dehydrogenase family)